MRLNTLVWTFLCLCLKSLEALYFWVVCLSVCPSVRPSEAQNTIFLAVQGSVGLSHQTWPFFVLQQRWGDPCRPWPSLCHIFPTSTAKPFFALISYLVETFLMGSPGLYNTYSYSTESLPFSGLIISQAVLTYPEKTPTRFSYSNLAREFMEDPWQN